MSEIAGYLTSFQVGKCYINTTDWIDLRILSEDLTHQVKTECTELTKNAMFLWGKTGRGNI